MQARALRFRLGLPGFSSKAVWRAPMARMFHEAISRLRSLAFEGRFTSLRRRRTTSSITAGG
jgi:hypothetical protein